MRNKRKKGVREYLRNKRKEKIIRLLREKYEKRVREYGDMKLMKDKKTIIWIFKGEKRIYENLKCMQGRVKNFTSFDFWARFKLCLYLGY